MFWDEIVLVTEQLSRYGLNGRLYDLGGSATPCIADYELTIKARDQQSRFITVDGRPWQRVDPSYEILELGSPEAPFSQLLPTHRRALGSALCLGILERVPDPRGTLKTIYDLMSEQGVLIVSSVFSYPYQSDGQDFWRFSPDGLVALAKQAGFTVLESGWRLQITADQGVLDTKNNKPQEVRSVYATLSRSNVAPKGNQSFSLPIRHDAQGQPEIFASTPKAAASTLQPMSIASAPAPRCVFLNTYYAGFLNAIYGQDASLATLPFARQLERLNSACFGDSDFYSSGLKRAGWHTIDLIINCPPLQQAWARENGSAASGEALVIEQVTKLKPDVIYIQDMHQTSAEFLKVLKSIAGLVVGQIASPLAPTTPVSLYDVIVSSFPHFVRRFREMGITSYYQPLAFSRKVMQVIENKPYQSRPVPCSFVGGISADHGRRYEMLNTLASQGLLDVWGYGAASLPQDSAITARHHGEVWGSGMFQALADSKITINAHIDAAENFANNMRLFEATGCGTLLITDYKENLDDLFRIGEEVVAYRSADECAALIKYYMANPAEAESIAAAGQRRTLTEHSYDLRMTESATNFERLLRYKREAASYQQPDMGKISYGYQNIAQGDITSAHLSAWKSTEIPKRQRALVQQELTSMYRGTIPQPFGVLAETLRPFVRRNDTILEIGCSSGYYFEVLEYLLAKPIRYTGVDYSAPMIELARQCYPKEMFIESDAAAMPFHADQFRIAISSCVILHMLNYREQIAETARVASELVVFHRTPICRAHATSHFKKLAYGVETVELRFNEREFLDLCAKSDLLLIAQNEFASNQAQDEYAVTYVFKKGKRW